MAHGNIGHVSASTFADLLSGPLVDIYVGKSRRHWSLHLNLLCHHSEQLESELDLSNDDKERRLDLPDHDPAGFELLVKWMYQGKLDDVSDFADPQQKYEYAVSCYKLYLLCERFELGQLKNVAMDQYRKGLHEAELVPDAEEINEIYHKSPPGSPFRQLMARIAARQIMDPETDIDIETYRPCFEGDPEFAIDLFKAIKEGTGGKLFDDPTTGDECQYHDHDGGPNCHIKGKGRGRQASKGLPPPSAALKSSKSDRFTNGGLRPLPRHQPPTLQNPPPPRQARLHGNGVGPLRRRISAPASSTVETSTETATGTKPTKSLTTPHDPQKELRRTVTTSTPPKKHHTSPKLVEDALAQSQELPTVPEESRPSSKSETRPPLPRSASTSRVDSMGSPHATKPDLQGVTSPRRGLWEWTRLSTGNLGIIGRIPHPEWKGPSVNAATSTPAGSTHQSNGTANGDVAVRPTTSESIDDVSLKSGFSPKLDHDSRSVNDYTGESSTVPEGIMSPVLSSPFAETKSSSDQFAEAEAPGGQTTPRASTPQAGSAKLRTPSPKPSQPTKHRMARTDDASSADAFKTPASQVRTPSSSSAVPKYKIALASSLLSRVTGSPSSDGK